MVVRRIVRLVVRRATPATLPGVIGLPTLAWASVIITPLRIQLSITSPAAVKIIPAVNILIIALIFIVYSSA